MSTASNLKPSPRNIFYVWFFIESSLGQVQFKARSRLVAGKPIDQVVGEISTPEWTVTGGELGTVHEGQLQAELP